MRARKHSLLLIVNIVPQKTLNLNPLIKFDKPMMLNKQQKRELRSDLFRHLDGIAVAPAAYTLYEKGVLQFILDKQTVSLNDICDNFNANEGYLNVALRLLCSQGWLVQNLNNESDSISYACNEKSKRAFDLCQYYKDVNNLMKFSKYYHKRKFQKEPFIVLNRIMNDYMDGYGLPNTNDPSSLEYQVLKNIEGIIVGPTTVSLGMGGMFHKYFMMSSFRAEEFHSDAESFTKILDFFTWLGWFEKKKNTYSFTEKGLFFAKRASAYGVTVSYIPSFRHLDELIFGNASFLREIGDGEDELHVDREMNVWGSGGAHAAYFKKMDEVIIDIFNKPIEEQPKGILDMGCGNGAFLIHAYEVIARQTKRGQMLDEHPLFLVGADYNQAAQRVTRANLIQADIWAKVIWGDIGRPDKLSECLKEDYNIDLSDLLNARTFLDHNRIWSQPETKNADRISTSTGAFAHRGQRISNNDVEDNLKEHFSKWMPFVKKHGLLLVELHSVDPKIVAENLGLTAATAYDGTHGFSDQYIVELGVFYKIAEESGLKPIDKYTYRFPDSELATVSINLLKGIE